ncbi:MAG: hypothetical protein LC637_01215, partial [Xanthomonadaceae bacterium]|nr:hypothetical protein [Xanthomonadaceae bacterium]
QTLQITLRRGSGRLNRWNSGAIVLQSSNAAFVTQRLPVGAVFSGAGLPDPLTLDVDANRGRFDLDLPDLLETSELVIRTSALVRPQSFTPRLVGDPTRNDALDSVAGTRRVFFDVPEDTLMLHAETFSSTSLDVDLFIGRDLNNDGQPQFDELRCSSQSPDDLERCQIIEPEAGPWWLVVQNWNASIEGSDIVPFELAVLAAEEDPSLVSFGPGLHPGGPISLPVYWDQPAMLRNERWIGAVGLASSPDALADVGVVSAALTRRAIEIPKHTALFESQPMPVVVAGGGVTHRKLFIDVPPTATRLTVDVEGDIDRATLRLRAFSSLAASVPDTPPAPANVLAEFTPTATGRRAVFSAPSGGRLTNARYYIVLENDQPQETLVTVTASVEELGSIPTQRGLWGPETRAINQGFDWEVGGDNSFLLWYTYDEQGLPTFYISAALPEDPQSSYFSAPLLRVTSNGERQTPVVVGEVQSTRIAADRMMIAWRLNGNHGAEMFNPNHGSSCPTINGQQRSFLGHWISQGAFTGGITWLITATSEAAVRYYYDRTNQPRWVIADTELPATLPNGNRMEVLDLRGWCAYCEPVPLEADVVGTLERQFLNLVSVRDVTDFVAGAGIDTSVSNDRQLLRLSNVLQCSNAESQN